MQVFRINAFQSKKVDFPFDPSGISGQIPAAADHSVARDQDADRIVPDRSTDRPCRAPHPPALPGEFRCDPSVGDNPSAGNPTQNLPDRKTERRTGRTKQRRLSRIIPLKITIQPFFCLFQYRQVPLLRFPGKGRGKIFLILEPQSGQVLPLARQSNLPQRRRIVTDDLSQRLHVASPSFFFPEILYHPSPHFSCRMDFFSILPVFPLTSGTPGDTVSPES